MDVPPSRERMIPVGRVLSPRGAGGEVQIEVLSDSPGRFAPGGAVFLRGKRLIIGGCSSLSRGRLALTLEGVYDRAQAEGLRGALLTVPEGMVPSLPEGQYYHFQLVDMDVFTGDGEYLGRITEVLSTGANDVLRGVPGGGGAAGPGHRGGGGGGGRGRRKDEGGAAPGPSQLGVLVEGTHIDPTFYDPAAWGRSWAPCFHSPTSMRYLFQTKYRNHSSS